MDRLTEHTDSKEDARNVTIEQVEILDSFTIDITLNSLQSGDVPL